LGADCCLLHPLAFEDFNGAGSRRTSERDMTDLGIKARLDPPAFEDLLAALEAGTRLKET
jgi:hypothetical protein